MRKSGKTHLFTAVAAAAAASLISKPFRVAFAGQTIDGREIKPEWLKDIAETYNPEKYTAEVWPEHFRGLTPDGDFKSQGSVMSVYTQVDEVDGEKALALYATIAPNASLVEMNRRGEKKYASLEVTENFRGSGKAYLTGMAVTDSPASIATEALKFSADHLHRQITDSIEARLEFTEQKPEPEKQPGMFAKAMQGFKDKLAALGSRNDRQLTELANGMSEVVDQFSAEQQRANESVTKLTQEVDNLRKGLEELKGKYAKLDSTDANPDVRPLATGSNGFVAVDY